MHAKTGRTTLAAIGVAAMMVFTALPASASDPVPVDVTPTATTSPSAAPEPSASPEPTSTETAPVVEPPASEAPSAPAVVEPTPAPAAVPAGSTATYRGVTVTVPDGWPVVDLEADPTACVRLDVHAVYLGAQGTAPTCPSMLVGRTSSIQLQPVPAELPYGTVTLTPGVAPVLSASQQIAGELVGVVPGTGVLVTASFADGLGDLAPVLAGLQSSGGAAARSATAVVAAAALPQQLSGSFTRYYGYGFDACTAPALSSINAWNASPYRSLGIYIGGAARGCSQPNLTASWVRSVASAGWHAQPIYVGLQAPCSQFGSRITYGQEWEQGRLAALDAIGRAQLLGIGVGSDIFYDMESYPQGSQCSGSVRAYLSAWTNTLRYNGYASGVYSSLSTGIEDLADGAAQPGFVAPDKIWIARWTESAWFSGAGSIYGHSPYVADNQWAPYSRIHQFTGGHNETWGGVTINIDSNRLDTDPSRGSPAGQLEGVSTKPATVTASGWALDPDTSGSIIVQMYIDGAYAGMASASGSRPDVGAAYPAAGPNHGYKVVGKTTTGRHSMCVYAVNTGPGNSTALGCRTVDVPTSNPYGQVDAVSTAPGSVNAKGWAIDPDTSSPIIVQLYLDGASYVMGWASGSRPDVGRVYPDAGPNHGFNLTISASTGNHTLCAFAVNTGAGATTSLGCRTVTVPSSNPFGRIDAVSVTGSTVTASGWAIDPKTSEPIIMQMYVDGARYAMGWANLNRPDIGAAYPSAGPKHGFSLSLPVSPGRHSVCVFALDSAGGPATTLLCHTITA